MKTCKCCGIAQPYSNFYDAKGNRDGKKNSCKDCQCIQAAERRDSLSAAEKAELKEIIETWKEENPEAVRAHAARWRKKKNQLDN